MSKIARRVLGLLRWPIDFPGRIKYADGIVSAIGDNAATFATPSPALATLTTSVAELSTCETAAATRALGAAAVRDAQWVLTEGLFEQELAYIQTVSDANPGRSAAIFALAGMSTREVPSRGPRGYKMTQPASTVVEIVAPTAGPRTAHIWQYGTTPGAFPNWMVTTVAKLTLTNQVPGTTLYVQYRVVTRTGYGEWSEVLSMLVK
jgi:hypothetical protein